MPFRFRKIFSLGKGMRLNFSKRGMSASIGKPGGTLNFSKRGIRPTVGLPGTGLSFTPTQSKAASNKISNNSSLNMIAFLLSVILICFISLCCIGILFYNTGKTAIPTNTPQAGIPIEQIIAMTANMANSQTQAFYSPTPQPNIVVTSTFTPTVTMLPLPTRSEIEIQTVDALSTYSIVPTSIIVYPTYNIPPSNAVCSCSGNTLNCKDFSTQRSAQACMNYCISKGVGDIHKLDGNPKNGLACESLP